MKKIVITKDISLPSDFVTQAIAILAKRRAGKSYTMRRITEQLFKANQQVVIVDPKGDQWGIRSSADGKRPGFPIVILGGEHGDIPLEVNGGELVAKLVVEERVSVLLDLSMFRKHEIATFMAIFLENLYRLKAREIYRTPLMVVIDEADAIAPQKPQKGEERMLGAADDIVRRGGQRGIGCMLVTQRSAVLNKNVLTQVQMLIVLRTIAPQDLAAMKAWIDVHGDFEQGKTLMSSLPSLPIGDAWFWSPGWPTAEGIFNRSHVLPIETFDSGATPKPGEKQIIPKNLADINLDALNVQMKATIEKAKADDPKLLRKKIAELEGQLKSSRITPEKLPNLSEIDKAVVRALTDAKRQFDKEKSLWVKDRKILEDLITKIHAISVAPKPMFVPEGHRIIEMPIRLPKKEPIVVSMPFKESIDNFLDDKPLSGTPKRILGLLASRYPMKLTWSQVATFSGLKASTGSFTTNKSVLRSKGLIEENDGLVWASTAGIEASGVTPGSPMGSDEVLDMWEKTLGGTPGRMFNHLRVIYSGNDPWVSREELAIVVGVKADTGSFTTNMSLLRSNGLIEEKGRMMKLHDNLFI